MPQFQAGYILDSIRKLFKNSGEEVALKMYGILQHLSYFEVTGNANFNNRAKNVDPLFFVLSNIISRGLPTLPSVYIEDFFRNTFQFGRKSVNDVGSIVYDIELTEEELLQKIYTAFHIIDPRIKSETQFDNVKESWERLGSEYEEAFLFYHLPKILGEEYMQIVESQRSMKSILFFAPSINEAFEKFLRGTLQNLTEQDVDFSIEFPYKLEEKAGIVIEIDGSQHEQTVQKKLDEIRDDAIERIDWYETIRIKTKNFSHIRESLKELAKLKDFEYFKIISLNYENPLYKSEIGLKALQLALSPFGIARIQKTIIELILSGVLDLGKERWRIGIIERDIPCAALAFEDLKKNLIHLCNLSGRKLHIPDLELSIFNTEEFKESGLNKVFSEVICLLSDVQTEEPYDIIIDHSILQRKGILNHLTNLKSRYWIAIRSSHGIKSHRSFYTDSFINYEGLIDDKNRNEEEFIYNLEKINSLKYFLQNIFRKDTFRPGQIEILNRSLQGKNVVGLLPTGGGKSLAYQLSALLQPGICLIVDPIKSLMKDQFDGLNKAGIDGAIYINSSIKTAWERDKATEKMVNAQVLFAFISPERFQIRNFREKLIKMTEDYGNYFSYCIIDEAHCVSEWGHDFRTSYLKLGENVMRFCKIKSKVINHVPMMGLTATASFDVLSDVQRELLINEESIVTSSSLERPELVYKIYVVNHDESYNRLKSEYRQRLALGEAKQDILVQLLNDLPFELEKQNEIYLKEKNNDIILKDFDPYSFYQPGSKYLNSGLVFCPHKTWIFGVEGVAGKIRSINQNIKLGTFVGSGGEFERDLEREENQSEIYQDEFINDKINLLVATKAFGMGIDKPNIRFTIHFNFPSSIESYYQEAGRAGRDGRLAYCYILFSNLEHDRKILESFHRNSFKGPEKEKWIIYELLKEISYPSETTSTSIVESMKEDLGIEVQLNLWKKDNPTRLYINEDYKKGYGYIHLSDLNTHPDSTIFTRDLSERILNYFRDKIFDETKKGRTINDILTKKNIRRTEPGIESQLMNIQNGESLPPIIVGFTNDAYRSITEYLQSNTHVDFTERIVKEASNYCFEINDFIKNLENKFYSYYHFRVDMSNINIDYLENLFNKIRDESDTYKAVYRLSVIGVVDDYEVDYNSKSIILHVSRKKDEDYIENLHQYLLRYISKERADKLYDEISEQKGKTTIQKCLGYLIDFVYGSIEKKRFNAIGSMESACIIGADQGPEALKDFIDIYFSSKYYPDLVDDTNQGKEFDYSLVLKYIVIVEGNIDNLKHLRGACTRLLIENPLNGALLLLKSYAQISLENSNTKSRLFKDGIHSFHDGFNIMYSEKNWTSDELSDSIDNFFNELYKINPDLRQLLDSERDLYFLRIHTNWLIDFNNKFTENHERRY